MVTAADIASHVTSDPACYSEAGHAQEVLMMSPMDLLAFIGAMVSSQPAEIATRPVTAWSGAG